jgi:hypothetical protein
MFAEKHVKAMFGLWFGLPDRQDQISTLHLFSAHFLMHVAMGF